MRSKVLWTTVSAVVLALSVASVALAATKDDSSASPAPQTRGAACGALLDDPAAADELQALCTEHRADMQAWFDAYGAARTSAARRPRSPSCAPSTGPTCRPCSRSTASMPVAVPVAA